PEIAGPCQHPSARAGCGSTPIAYASPGDCRSEKPAAAIECWRRASEAAAAARAGGTIFDFGQQTGSPGSSASFCTSNEPACAATPGQC
ncbi:MAG TPA: hypothetical protein VN893_03285, partial [Bryobacteraceae bacterium]|nr:hypothetical protein [Bryobacteraceae bacterium]